MVTINSIIDTVKEFVEATKSAFKIDVMVVDENKKIIAATGELEKMVGEMIVDSGIINTEIFTNRKKHFIVSDTMNNPMCKKCNKYGKTCSYKRVVATGIYDNNELKGVISLNALNDRQVEFMNDNEENIANFLHIVSNMLNSKIIEKKVLLELRSSTKFLDAIYSNITKGVIITDKDEKITKVNKYMQNIISAEEEEILGKRIKEVFRDYPVETTEITDATTHNEISIKVDGQTKFLIYTTMEIVHDNLNKGTAYFFDDTKLINEISYKSFERNDSINLDNIITNDVVMINFKSTVRRISKTDSTILLLGETGTGKELFARSIHHESTRTTKPFVAINCGAIPETLIESELFGYERGTFTGANNRGKHGKFFFADKGTIFLDEVENMPLYLQQKLLRVIDRKEVERIGSHECIPIDVRIISATNKDLLEMVKRGEFREDLYHRLNVIGLNIPPLRERGQDVLVLSNYFINIFNKRFNKKIIGLSSEVRSIFLKYNWKGNIRELQNTIEYSINMETTDYIEFENLPTSLRSIANGLENSKPNMTINQIEPLEIIERRYIKKALEICGNNDNGIIETSKHLGISRSTMYRKIKKYDI
jgi:transcriptional regulator with PAS, ATPase and Fis domain